MGNRKTGVIIVVVIVIIFLIGGAFYLGTLYDDWRNDTSNEVNKNEEQTEEKEVNEEEINALVNTLGKELFARTNYSYGNNDDYYLYSNDTITYNNIANKRRLELALKNVNDVIEYNIQEVCLNEEDDKCLSLSVSKTAFETTYKELFGSDKDIKYEPFSNIMETDICHLVDNTIKCYTFIGGNEFFGNKELYYDYAELIDSDLNIYVKSLASDPNGGVYADVEMNNLVTTDEELLNYYGDELRNILYEKYQNKASIYKLTFKKESNGNWYWTKTEPVL